MGQISKIKISGQTEEYTIKATVEGLGVNESGNLELSSVGVSAATKGKVNVVSQNDVQIKIGTGGTLQLDTEYDAEAQDEYSVKFCNGNYDKEKRVIAAKINVAELVLDTQKANTDKGFDKEEMQVKFRNDKWNGGEVSDKTGPIQVKLKGRSFDIRCHDHGGIALQIAGHDGSNHENKIKFESDRTTAIGTTPAYCKEGGKGVEFGTFNNEHTSLFTGDYRFKGDAKVYGVTRGTISATTTGKMDYPTQADDFKDIIDENNCATWNQIITVAKNGGMASGYTYTAGQYINISDDHVISVTGITSGGSVEYQAGSGISIENNVISVTGMPSYVAGEGIVISGDTIKVEDGLALLKDHARITDSGNLELSVSGADTNINITSEKNIKLDAAAKTRLCTSVMDFDYEIDKEGNVDGYGFPSISFTFKNKLNKTKVTDEVWAQYSGVTCSGCTDVSTETKIDRTLEISVPVIDLIRLIDRVSALETKCTELETRMNGYHPAE